MSKEHPCHLHFPLAIQWVVLKRVVSSGIVLGINEFRPPQFPFLHSFAVTFNEPGTYDYFCAFHPGMFGQVVVSGDRQLRGTNKSEINSNMTGATTIATAD